jgi:hypothetical protein
MAPVWPGGTPDVAHNLCSKPRFQAPVFSFSTTERPATAALPLMLRNGRLIMIVFDRRSTFVKELWIDPPHAAKTRCGEETPTGSCSRPAES